MSDLSARLQEHLGQTYRLERELGGGGMSRVFLATETRLGRRVVIKVLPPDMTAAVHADRFEREIQVAASLQHPHIVPLLTAGSAGELLYYVMPYIEGESLGARLAREGALPVNDAVRILRDVIDALAYSHARGVVHRDIKPDNILLSGRHALVTDFGVAKAVSLSSGGGGLTSSNVALGTPAYMAPEQAAADPHVDQRADLYAVGVVAYEMLSGRTPFQAPTPQQMLAAHVTTPPEPLDKWRPGLPAALTGTVMKSLVKHAADRWQTAEEVAHALEGVMPTSGGITPVETAAHRAVTADLALRRFAPGRVVVRFLLAALLVVGVSFALTRLLALPDWVWITAGALMLAGFPVMLYTGRVERHRAVALTLGSAALPAPAHHAWFTWERARFGGVLALGALALVAVGYGAGRVFGIGPAATLRSTGRLGDADRMVLADLVNRTADTTLGATLTEAARVDLAQSRVVRLLAGQELQAARRRMGIDPGATLTDSAAMELARREGAKGVVTGEVRPLGAGYVLTGRILDAASGAELVSERAEASGTADLLPALDKLARALRERAGESLRQLRASEPLAQVTTQSLDALRVYSSGLKLFDAGRYEDAIPVLRRAVALDSIFAMAWRKLAAAYGNIGNVVSRDSAVTRAYEARAHLPPLERDLAEAAYAAYILQDEDRAIEAYRAALAVDPTDDVATNNLAMMLNQRFRFAEAEAVLRPVLAAGTGVASMYEVMAGALQGQGRRAATDSFAALLAERLPARAGWGRLLVAEAALTDHDPVAALRALDSAGGGPLPAALQRREANDRSAAEILLGHDAASAGLVTETASGYWAVGARGAALSIALATVYEQAAVHADRGAAERALQATLARFPLDSIPPIDRPYQDLAAVMLELGRPGEVVRLHAEAQAAWAGHPLPRYFEASWEVFRSLAAGNDAQAVRQMRQLQAASGCGRCGLFQVGRAFERLGMPDSAIAAYVAAESLPAYTDFADIGVYESPVMFRLGELYEGKGDRAQAMEWYQRFIDRWRTADPVHQGRVTEARTRLARLKEATD